MKMAGKIVTGFAGAAALALAGCSNEAEGRLKALDLGETFIFTSIDDCMSNGFTVAACEDSKESAHKVSLNGKSGSAWPAYKFETECTQKHIDCFKWVDGNYASKFHPRPNAWQALKSDITIASALFYVTGQNNSPSLSRVDGRNFSIR